MGVNIDEILASLEQEKTAEANFADNISSEAPTENVSESPEAEATTETTEEAPVSTDESTESTKEAEETDEEIAKIAAECDAQGRIMARAFVSEINKVAAAEGEEYSEGSETSEPVTEEEPVSNETEEVADTDGAEEVEETKEANANGADAIISELYNNYFGGEE